MTQIFSVGAAVGDQSQYPRCTEADPAVSNGTSAEGPTSRIGVETGHGPLLKRSVESWFFLLRDSFYFLFLSFQHYT